MNTALIFKDIIKVNKRIVNNGVDKHPPRSKEMQRAYNTDVKPLLSQFFENHKTKQSDFFKQLFNKTDHRSIENIKFRFFGNWGQKVNPHVWATFYIDNEKVRPASHSVQLYVLVDHNGLKFGFDYGDKVSDSDDIVLGPKTNTELQGEIITAINKFNMLVINHEAGSPSVGLNHRTSDNLIKGLEDFESWNKNIHIIKEYALNNIPSNIEDEIVAVIDSLLPLIKETKSVQKLDDVGYWLYSAGPNAKEWDNQFKNGFMSIDYDFPDDLSEFSTKTELEESRDEYGYEDGNMNTIKALWDFSHEINVGDVIVSKKGRSKYLGYGIVVSDYIFQAERESHPHIRKVKWIKKGEWGVDGKISLPVKTLTNITQYNDWVSRIKDKMEIDKKPEEQKHEFSLEKVLKDVFLPKDQFLNIVDILAVKKNIILQGSAGVGKTFIAKKIAMAFQEHYGEERIEMIQFHQSYSYEDFMQGYRPTNNTFELKNGTFYEVCERAKKDTSVPFFLIIDEINRGNLSKIFGELMMLIEADKRGEKNKIKLTYSSGEYFYIPDNLYIIGTMNTADRSLTIVDYALRRRFAFIKMRPNFNEPFESFLERKGISKETISTITSKMKSLNNVILNDDSLGDGFEIGHSYFCSYKTGEHKKWLSNVFKYEIIPLIEEYWFDDQQLIDQYTSIIRE